MAAQRAQLVALLRALQSADNEARRSAETVYQKAKQSDPNALVVSMVAVLGATDLDEQVQSHSAILLHRLVMRGPEKDFLFPRLPQESKLALAAELLRLFREAPQGKLRRKIGHVIAKLAEYVCDESDSRGHLDPSGGGWPALLPETFRMANCAAAGSEDSCVEALYLLKALVRTMKTRILGATQELGQVLQACLASGSCKVRAAVLVLISVIVCECGKQAWTPLLPTAVPLLQVLQQLAGFKEEELLQEALQAMTEIATREPDFFRAQLSSSMEPAAFMTTLAKTREGFCDPGSLRNLALEWLVAYLEKRSKWLVKNLPAYVGLVLEACMEAMVEIDDDAEELEAWAQRMDDEEEDDDSDLRKCGEEAIDRVVACVWIEAAAEPLFRRIALYASQERWQSRHAALAAVKQTVEYVEDPQHVDEMAKLLLTHADHPHVRVRYIAMLALGQLSNDQAPHFQESSHQTVLPVLLRKMDDPVDRVAAMAMSAFVSFCEALDPALMVQYTKAFMEKAVTKLRTTQHRGVREESITTIAVLAGAMGKDFSAYYDGVMPMLKDFVIHATGEAEGRLRGKSFECMSLLGLAVGKEKFLPDAREAVSAMLQTQLQEDDVQRTYIRQASDRICQCLKRDFVAFLPMLLPRVLAKLKLEDDEEDEADGVDCRKEDADEYHQVTVGDGRIVAVHSARLEEILEAVKSLNSFAEEIGPAYFDWVAGSAEALLPLLAANDNTSYLCDELRHTAMQAWALLIKCARTGAAEKGMATCTLARDLLRTGLEEAFKRMEQDTDAETLSATACGAAKCIKSVGQGSLGQEEVRMLVDRLFSLIDKSFERTRAVKTLRQETSAKGFTREAGDDDEPEYDEEEQCRQNFEEMLGAVMEVAPADFLPLLPHCADRIKTWIATKENKVLALWVASDLVKHLKGHSEPAWSTFMPEVFTGLASSDRDVAVAASYIINFAAPLASFKQASPEAFRKLADVLARAKPKRRNDKAKLLQENAVAALLALAKHQAGACPPEVQPWQLILGHLPLKFDQEVAKKVHDEFAQLTAEQHEGLLGGPASPSLGQVLSILSEVYEQSDICTPETGELIRKIFRALPTGLLKGCADRLTEKQQRKIEKLLSS